MKRLQPEFVYAYHGCDESVAKRILESGDPMSPSYNAYDWLGSGIYFWEDAPERALQWAVEMKKPKPAVLGAVIELGNCLNLLDVSSHEEIAGTYQALIDSGAELPRNRKRVHPLDCLVLNMVCDYAASKGKPYDVIRGAFPEGDPIFPGSMLLAKTHIQLCVRNPAKIIRIFRA